ncbi:MAG TPA: DUF2341 domain-containing protein, partial [Nitrospirae bacterium]|nr:DUF2341 domain-containing protein [Nitrospirota bacterium]
MYTKDVKRETAIKILLSGLLFFFVLTSQSCSSSNWSVPGAASNLSPTVVITSPLAGNISDKGTNITFTGSANDPEDGVLTGAFLVWTSDRDGQIGTGLTFAITTLSRGIHVITLTAADGSGGQGTAVMTITVRTPWFGSQWGYRQQITISASMAPLDQTDFPALIQITDQNNPLFDNAQAGGDDILFTDLDGVNQLDHEIELYSSTGTEELDAWVKIPDLSSTEDTIIYMYYGDPGAANQENINAVWSNDFIMVQHLNESPANGVAGHIDSAPITDPKKVPYNFIPQNFDGVVGTTDAAGKIAGADYFAGDDDFLASDPTFYGSDQFRNVYFVDHWSNVPADPDRNGTWTFSAWVQTPTAGRAVFSEGNNA